MSTQLQIKKLCVIGVGLIGGSVARALRKAGVVKQITGAGRDATHLDKAVKLGVIDDYATDVAQAASGADVILIATPLGAIKSVLTALKPVITPQTIITDVGSAKECVIDAVTAVFGDFLPGFVPGHPIAGTERSGVEASFAELFQERRVILSPHLQTSKQALETIRQIWQACGATVVEMEAHHHDEVLAATSHLPHMLAFALVDTLARMNDRREIFEYAAGGFRDFTRIASSDPDMWHDIFMSNRKEIVKVLRAYNQDLARLTQAVENGESEFLKETFKRAKNARDKFCG
jgi:prephenate dehydrogenase